ncbi:MAG: glycogen/starch synthase [bacterium]
MKNPLSIVSVAAEVQPFSKAGGVADVASQLPKALARLGFQVIVVTPLHGGVDREKHRLRLIAENVPIHIDDTSARFADFWQGQLLENLPVYFIDNKKYFSSHKRIYGTQYQNTRYLFFNLAVFKLLNFLTFSPDILHCHDWQTGLLPHLLHSRFRMNPLFAHTHTVFTIHNLTFQFARDWWAVPQKEKDDGRGPLPSFNDKHRVENVNFAKRAILNADIINTVSETYAAEILTQEFGQDLHRILLNRRDRFFGIINGIDYFDYNPATDPGLYRHYDVHSLSVKKKDKLFLQRMTALPEDAETPLIAMAGRVTEQKGYDLLVDVLEPLMRLDLQVIVMGGGDKKYESFLRKAVKKYPKKFAYHPFDTQKVTQVYAGSDFFLMPSRFEPCGLGQMISLRYGSVPIVHAVGGLSDTISDYNPATMRGLGFVFKKYDSREMLIAIARALELYKNQKSWFHLVEQGMKKSYSWEIPARKYVTLYKRAMATRHQNA